MRIYQQLLNQSCLYATRFIIICGSINVWYTFFDIYVVSHLSMLQFSLVQFRKPLTEIPKFVHFYYQYILNKLNRRTHQIMKLNIHLANDYWPVVCICPYLLTLFNCLMGIGYCLINLIKTGRFDYISRHLLCCRSAREEIENCKG